MKEDKIVVTPREQGMRIDVFLTGRLGERFSRSQIKKNIESGLVQVNGRAISPHYKVKAGEEVDFVWPHAAPDQTRAEDIPLSVLYEDEHLLIVDKPVGMVVHPAHGNPSHTLVNALLFHFKTHRVGAIHGETVPLRRHELPLPGGPTRPGIVHRLDKDSSGVMVVAKNERAHASLAKQFKHHTVEKVYDVFVRGVIQHDEGICEEPVGRAFLNRKKVIVKPSGGRDAETHFRVKQRFKNATWVGVFPKTGRTHQVRVHMGHLGHPVLGDLLYGVPHPAIQRQALHAFSLAFQHPSTHERMYFEAPMPEDMKFLLEFLKSSTSSS